MANINLNALNMFSTAKDWSANSIANLDGKSGLPVVKVLTDELIDELGPKILREYFRN